MDIPGVVVYHPADAETPGVRMAAEAVEIDGSTPVAAYLDAEKHYCRMQTDRRWCSSPRVWFSGGNAGFARRLAEEGIIFIGPLPETIELMGNKVAARSFCIDNNILLKLCDRG